MPGREAQTHLVHQPLAERQAVGRAVHFEEHVHRARRQRRFDAGNRIQLAHQKIPRLLKAREGVLDDRFALFTATTPALCTKGGEQEVLYSSRVPRSGVSSFGATIQPRRQPVMSQDLENVLVLTMRSCASVIARNEGAMPSP